MKKRGISAVVATVLIILITVASVTLVWQAIIPMIKDNLDFSVLEGRVSIVTSGGYTFYDAANKKASVQIERENDDAVMSRVNVIFSVGGNSISTSVVAPSPGNKKTYIFDFSGKGVPESVSVAPIFVVGEKEKTVDVTSEGKMGEGTVSSISNLNLLFFEDSLINSDSWEIGTGGSVGYTANGAASENVREMGIGPYGESVLLWKAVPDSISNGDGGFNSLPISIDSSKTYRSTVWIKKTGSNDGDTYFGTSGGIAYLSGTSEGNPYFWYGDLPELNKWYLLVGYIHGSGYVGMSSYGGIYDGETGAKVVSFTSSSNGDTDFKFVASATTSLHRAYLFYDTTTTDRQYFWNPTFTEVSSSALPIEV